MYSSWYRAAVTAFWLATMGWLLVDKVVPPLVVGEPPSYRSVLDHRDAAARPVGWTIVLDERELGWAISDSELLESGGHRINGRVRFNRLPVAELMPAWVRAAMTQFGAIGSLANLRLTMEVESCLELDELGQPLEFTSDATWRETGLNEQTDGPTVLNGPQYSVALSGTVDGNRLRIVVKSGSFTYRTEVYMARDAMMGDALTPQPLLPDLRVGQSWTVPVYNPFQPPNRPIEILHAEVTRRDWVPWAGELIPTLIVEHRSDAGEGLSGGANLRGRAWVADDGTVIRQAMYLNGSQLVFERMPDAFVESLSATAAQDSERSEKLESPRPEDSKTP